MSKLKQLPNKCFPAEFQEYLEENGFMLGNTGDIFNMTFMKDDRAIVITADRASFRFFDADEDQQKPVEFAEHACFEGLSTLNLMGWVFLLHAVQMISINQSINNYRRQSKKEINLKLHHTGTKTLNMVQLAESIFSNVRTMMLLICFAMLAFTSCKPYKILAVQDFKKDETGKWVKTGTPHIMPDTITTIHAYVWIKGSQVYPY